jgi:hypothetical protein
MSGLRAGHTYLWGFFICNSEREERIIYSDMNAGKYGVNAHIDEENFQN